MLDGDLLAYSSMAISLFSGLFLVAIHTVKTARWIPFKERRGTDGTTTSRSINLPQGESHRDNSMLVKRATPEDVYGAFAPARPARHGES